MSTAAERAFKIKRAKQSQMCRARKKAKALGITVEEYLESIIPMSYDERKARRNQQSKDCRKRKLAEAKEYASRVETLLEESPSPKKASKEKPVGVEA